MLTSEKSIRIGELLLSLDHSAGDLCFVSHAHSDHAVALLTKKPVLASEETLAIAGSKKIPHPHPGCKLLDAGHMLGAKQLLAQIDGGNFVYTGDLRLSGGLTSPPAQVPKADTVLIEGTYGSPEWKFPKREEVFSEMERWVKQNGDSNIVFGAYETGKAQELVAFLNKYCQIAPLVTPKMDRVCGAYGKFGVKLERISMQSDEGQGLLRSNFVAIMPHHRVDFSLSGTLKDAYGRETKTALATGWALYQEFPVDRAFPLSDHADFQDILSYLRETGAKRVYCTHGDEQAMAAHLRHEGFDAFPLLEAGQPKQLTLVA